MHEAYEKSTSLFLPFVFFVVSSFAGAEKAWVLERRCGGFYKR
jgi:hypothetical protein